MRGLLLSQICYPMLTALSNLVKFHVIQPCGSQYKISGVLFMCDDKAVTQLQFTIVSSTRDCCRPLQHCRKIYFTFSNNSRGYARTDWCLHSNCKSLTGQHSYNVLVLQSTFYVEITKRLFSPPFLTCLLLDCDRPIEKNRRYVFARIEANIPQR